MAGCFAFQMFRLASVSDPEFILIVLDLTPNMEHESRTLRLRVSGCLFILRHGLTKFLGLDLTSSLTLATLYLLFSHAISK